MSEPPSGRIRSRPVAVALGFLLANTALFLSLYRWLGDGVFILSNLLPLLFAALFGMRAGLIYATVHVVYSIALGGMSGASFERFASHGIPASLITIALSGAIGRIRDLTVSLRAELDTRRQYERELQEHRAHLESLVEQRTHDLIVSNDQLRQEIAERERAETEKQHLAASLKRAEKMEAIGVLAGSVAHDLNNILSSVLAYPEVVLLDLPEDSPYRDALLAIQEAGQRAAAVVDDLLTMARRGVSVHDVLNLNDLVAGLMASPELTALKARHPAVAVETRLAPGLLNVVGSAVHLTKAILNLMLNSMEALEKNDGRITLSTSNVYIDAPSAAYEVLSEGEFVTLTVEDNGTGIAPQDLERIFEPFYTKKKMGRSGTGLGMAIVWGTVKDHGGFVDVRSEPGKGTTVTLLLPATRAHVRGAPARLALGDYLGHGESVLVVDDVPTQRALCTAILTRLGYTASAVASGEEAVEHIRRQAVDLLILDMIMEPGIDGLETYGRIVALRPGQRAIIASGFAETHQVERAQALGAGTYIRKPYTIEKLAVAVKEELQRVPSAATLP
jgi:two-component system cell cycle sensor histidine kinase/response regulator CckA